MRASSGCSLSHRPRRAGASGQALAALCRPVPVGGSTRDRAVHPAGPDARPIGSTSGSASAAHAGAWTGARCAGRPPHRLPAGPGSRDRPGSATLTFTRHRCRHGRWPSGRAACRCSGTPRLLAWCEAATCAALEPTLAPGSTSVGTRITLEHLAASAVGQEVEVSASTTFVDGRLHRFTVSRPAPGRRRQGDRLGRGDPGGRRCGAFPGALAGLKPHGSGLLDHGGHGVRPRRRPAVGSRKRCLAHALNWRARPPHHHVVHRDFAAEDRLRDWAVTRTHGGSPWARPAASAARARRRRREPRQAPQRLSAVVHEPPSRRHGGRWLPEARSGLA